jgi:hypothetical protein
VITSHIHHDFLSLVNFGQYVSFLAPHGELEDEARRLAEVWMSGSFVLPCDFLYFILLLSPASFYLSSYSLFFTSQEQLPQHQLSNLKRAASKSNNSQWPTQNQTTTNPSPTDPIDYFNSIPSDKSIVSVQVPDRTPIASTESAFVRETLNTSNTVKACVVMLKYIKPTEESKKNGDSKERPFIEVMALIDLQSGVNGYAKTAHGGIFGVVLDEVMGTAANMQSGAFSFFVSCLPFPTFVFEWYKRKRCL